MSPLQYLRRLPLFNGQATFEPQPNAAVTRFQVSQNVEAVGLSTDRTTFVFLSLDWAEDPDLLQNLVFVGTTRSGVLLMRLRGFLAVSSFVWLCICSNKPIQEVTRKLDEISRILEKRQKDMLGLFPTGRLMVGVCFSLIWMG
ncbi:hypothetical protein VTL71DRAFT_11290, partial [Oculimacula yallundae]